MNKIKFLSLCGLLSVMAFCFNSCSKDETGSTGSLTGTWEQVYYYYHEKQDGVLIEEGTSKDNDLRLEFKADGTFRDGEYDNGEWEWYGQNTWSLKGDKLTLFYKGEDEPVSLTVKELTSTRLVVELYFKEAIGGTTYESLTLKEFRKISD